MVKNESAQNWFEPERPDRARLPDSGAANGSKNGLRMKKLFSFKVFSISIKKGQIGLCGKILLKKEYSTEYSGNIPWNIPQNILGNIPSGSQWKGATWLARRPPRGPKAEWNWRLKDFWYGSKDSNPRPVGIQCNGFTNTTAH